jgi:predicted dehydrogenase
MGRHHARVLSDLPGVELTGVVEPNPPDRAHVRFVSDLDILLSEGIDLAVIAVPTALHETIALRLAAAGVHALVEKPVASDVASSERMADAFEAAGLVGCVGHIERYNPAIRELRRRVLFGELGEVYQIATRRQGPYPERIADVGVILDLATHDIDLTSWVSGRPYETVFARTASRSGREHEDLVAAVGSLSDGTVVSHLVNWLSPFKERVTVVAGERGCFAADTLTADLTFHANGVAPVAWDTLASFRGVVAGDVTRFAIAKREPLVLELSAFRDAVAGREAEIVSIREAATVVAVAARLLDAAIDEHSDDPRGAS